MLRVGLIKHPALRTDGEESFSSHATSKKFDALPQQPIWKQVGTGGGEWARGGPSGRRVMDPGLSRHQDPSEQRMVAECGLQCVGRELVKV